MLCQHLQGPQLFGAWAGVHRWIVTLAAYLGFFFFFFFFYIKWAYIFLSKTIWCNVMGYESTLNSYHKHRDKKYDGSTQCYILWAGTDLIKRKMEFVSTKPILSKNLPRHFSDSKEWVSLLCSYLKSLSCCWPFSIDV